MTKVLIAEDERPIAAVHGGTLQISSQVGVGTAVTVTLPKEVQP